MVIFLLVFLTFALWLIFIDLWKYELSLVIYLQHLSKNVWYKSSATWWNIGIGMTGQQHGSGPLAHPVLVLSIDSVLGLSKILYDQYRSTFISRLMLWAWSNMHQLVPFIRPQPPLPKKVVYAHEQNLQNGHARPFTFVLDVCCLLECPLSEVSLSVFLWCPIPDLCWQYYDL